MPLSPPALTSLSTLVSAYEHAFDRALTLPAPADLVQPDSAFTQLRLAVARHWPAGAAAVVAVGLRAQELVEAAYAGLPLGALHHAHARAVSELRARLHGAGSAAHLAGARAA